jgi:phospholipase C
LLVSPRIAAGTVFRAKRGTIDHTSVLKTIELRWNIPPLTARDKAAPDLGAVLTLSVPRVDDPLQGIDVPISNQTLPEVSQPSDIERFHAEKVSTLALRNQQGSYDEHTVPDLPTSAAVGEYIQTRTAAWRQHLQRREVRRQKRAAHHDVAARNTPRGKQKGATSRRAAVRKKPRRKA